MKLRIKKRDGSLQKFDNRKIQRALLMAYHEVEESTGNVGALVGMISAKISSVGLDDVAGIVDIELVQDIIETILMEHCPIVAKEYITYRQQRQDARTKRLVPDPTALANYIHFSKYSRFDPKLNRRETYKETVDRVLDMHLTKYPNIGDTIMDAFKFVYEKKVLPSMRSMQFAGPAIEQQNARMYNCAYTLIDRPEVFGHILYLLLCGCGVGFSVQWCHIDKLPTLKKIGREVSHCTIPDSIEGWASALNELIISFTYGYHVEFNYSEIRNEGKLLRTSGGLAPGHLPLKNTLENIRKVLLKAQGRKLRPIECHDIICFTAEAVLAGGIRRSSLISIFSSHDTEMLYAKASGNYDPVRGVNIQRAMANNSASILRNIPNNDQLFHRIIRIAQEGFGDPGFFFTNDVNHGCNPCGEIGIDPIYDGKTGFGFCNLCEINMAVIQNNGEFYLACEAAAIIGTLQAGYTDFPFLGDTTEQIVRRDALLGVGMAGMMDNPELAFDITAQRNGARIIRESNELIAKKIGILNAVRCTTIKPGGTAPLELGGVACGIHPHHARRYFRRVTANSIEPALLHFMKTNPHMVEEKPNGDKCIVFPVQVPDAARTVKEMPAKEFMEFIFLTYRNWILRGDRRYVNGHPIESIITHNVSATVTLGPEEREEVFEMVLKNEQFIAAMSFAPRLLDKKFPFAPMEEVTPADESKWNYLLENYRPVDWEAMKESGQEVLRPGVECGGPKCEL